MTPTNSTTEPCQPSLDAAATAWKLHVPENSRPVSVAYSRQDLLEPIQAMVTLSCHLVLVSEEKESPQLVDFRQLHEAATKLLQLVKEATAVVAAEKAADAFEASLRLLRHDLGNHLNHVGMLCQFLMMREQTDFFGAFLKDLEAIYTCYLDCEQRLLRFRTPPPSDRMPAAAAPRPERLRVEPANLLIVDDSPIGRQALRQLLTLHDRHQIWEAENGARALEMMHEHSFDLVLLDLLMPGFDGYQVLQHLKNHPNMAHSPILVISGNQDTQAGIRCIELGAEDYLGKPVDFLHLQARVSSCLMKRQLRLRELEQFFPTQVARQLLSKPEVLQKGRKANVTVLFCDIRGFSRISEKLGPRKTVRWVSAVMEVLSECVLRNNGVVVDFQGDELLAMWGAPDAQPEHPQHACQAALEMLAQVKLMNRKWKAIIGSVTEVGIGINTGPAHVGNTGSQRKFKYGPLGNTVNLGSRVQGATKYLKTRLLITGATRKHLGERFAVRRVSTIQAVNIKKPVNLYELFPDGHPGWPELKERYEKALELFESRKLKDAAELLGNLITQQGAQGPELSLMARTIESLVDPKKWTRVWDLPGK